MKTPQTIPQPVEAEWKVTDLKPHPQQNAVFTPVTFDDLQRLVADIEANGLKTRLDILPDGTIVGGHSRLAAVTVLEWETVPVTVRHDLVAKGEQAILDFLVDDNRVRRQLSHLELARVALVKLGQAKALAMNPAKRQFSVAVKDRIAKELNMTRRNLDRLLRVLTTPEVVQAALSRGLLTVESAGKIAGLDNARQTTFAALIQSYLDREEELGVRLRDELCAAVKKELDRSIKPRRPHSGMAQLVKALKQGIADLDHQDQLAAVRSEHWASEVSTLRKARKLMDRLIERVENAGVDEDMPSQAT